MSARAYRPHRAWENPLYHAVAGNLATFLAGRQRNGRPVPFFIVRDFRAYLDCGVPAHGFLRVHCDDCGRDRIVPFSCKGLEILDCLGMPIRAPPIAPAQSEDWGFDDVNDSPVNSEAYA